VYWGALTIALACLGWGLSSSLLSWTAPGAAGMATLILILSMRRSGLPRKAIFICLGWVVLAICASLLLGGAGHDFSVDGQDYHQQAILAMMQGWNPIKETHYAGHASIWLSHYAKGPWILAAALGVHFGIEYGKAIFWLFAFALAGASYVLFLKQFHLSRRAALAGAVLIACNPVFASQLQTFYVDGLLGSLVSLTAIAACMLVLNPSLLLAGAVSSCLILAINLKFTAGPFVIVLLGVIWLWCLFAQRHAAAKALMLAGAAGVVLGGCIGFNPYLSNMLDHRHPFYPLAGEGKVDILTMNGGTAFLASNRFYKAALSLASDTNNVPPQPDAATGAARPKIPGVITKDELRALYTATDLRMGGFGPWASLAFLLGVVYVVLAVRRNALDMRAESFLPMAVVIALLASAFIMPDFWWARYAPQLWTALVFAVVFAFSLDQPMLLRRAGLAALGIIAANMTLVLGAAAGNRFMQEMDYRAQVASLRQISARAPVRMHVNLDSVRHRLKEERVVFEEGATTSCGKTDDLRGSGTTLCVPEASLTEYRMGSEWIAKVLHRGSVSGEALGRR
jgi:hypothetical protein